MIKAQKLAHIVLSVSNLEASRDFYVNTLGLEVVSEPDTAKVVFLSLGKQHHDLALVEAATGAPPDATQPGLVHMAWQLNDFAELQAAYKDLVAAGIPVDPIQHNITNSLYVRDPDGHQVELFCDRWDNGIQVLRETGPQRRELDMETGEAVGAPQQLLQIRR